MRTIRSTTKAKSPVDGVFINRKGDRIKGYSEVRVPLPPKVFRRPMRSLPTRPTTLPNTSAPPLAPDESFVSDAGWEDEGPPLNIFDPTPLRSFQLAIDQDSKVNDRCIVI